MAVDPSLLHEIGPDGLAREAPVIAYTEKMIENEQLQLRNYEEQLPEDEAFRRHQNSKAALRYIDENYSKIRDVERELANLSMEMKLTAGPKKAALEHLRKKIEASTERIRLAKIKEDQARKELEVASKAVQDEEALKQKLCEDLSNLVQESSSSQLARLEELKRRLGALNPTRSSGTSTQDEKSAQSTEVSAVPATEIAAVQGNVASVTNGANQQSSADGGKKKVYFQGKGRGIGAIPKSRNPGPGWTGAGFDVDNRT